jgi:hypothetical protein
MNLEKTESQIPSLLVDGITMTESKQQSADAATVASLSSTKEMTALQLSPPSSLPKKKKKKVSSILERLRIIKVSPSRGTRQGPKVPPPNEVVVVKDMPTPSSCSEREEIEESLEVSKKILRKPSRFTFDLVPSISESYDDSNLPTTNKGLAIVNVDSGLSILDDTERPNGRTCFQSKDQDKGTFASGPSKLDQRIRTNSTSGTSEMSYLDNLVSQRSHPGSDVASNKKLAGKNDKSFTKEKNGMDKGEIIIANDCSWFSFNFLSFFESNAVA